MKNITFRNEWRYENTNNEKRRKLLMNVNSLIVSLKNVFDNVNMVVVDDKLTNDNINF